MLSCCSDDDDDDEPVQPTEEEDIFERDWKGLCYTASLAWLSAAEEDGWVLIHGTVLSNNEKHRINHAWCERGDLVVDLARPIGARTVPREEYYRLAKPEVQKVYSSEDARILAIKNRHDGPWSETEQMKK